MGNTMQFTGASGAINIDGNDLPGRLASWQVVGDDLVMAGWAESSGTGAIDTSDLDAKYWTAAPADPVVEMSASNWESVLGSNAALMMYSQKMARLFLQAAQRVNTLDSRVQ